jgi:hypothetical protein
MVEIWHMELEVYVLGLYCGFLKLFEMFSCIQQWQTVMNTSEHWKGNVYYLLENSLQHTILDGTPAISLVILFWMVKSFLLSVAYRAFLLLL